MIDNMAREFTFEREIWLDAIALDDRRDRRKESRLESANYSENDNTGTHSSGSSLPYRVDD